MAFLYNSSLSTHVRLHTGEKKYECRVCIASFRQSGQLKKHLRKIHDLNESTRNNRCSDGNFETSARSNSCDMQSDIQCHSSGVSGTSDLLLEIGAGIVTGIDSDDKFLESSVNDVEMENRVSAEGENIEVKCGVSFPTSKVKAIGDLEYISDKG